MDHLIGQRFNLISKSEIRYVGTLHEINPEQSTIALEDVYSFGTEDRKPDNFIPPSQQKFDYIVFRGSDVKDIKIVEEQKEPKAPSPPTIPDDPAILNSSRPGASQRPPQDQRGPSPFPPPGYMQPPPFGGYPAPPPPQFGRGFGPPSGYGPGPQFYPGPPPPAGFYGPPRQGFQQGPSPFPQPAAPVGPPAQRNQAPAEQPSQNGHKQTSELPDNKASLEKLTSPPKAIDQPQTIQPAQPPVEKTLIQPTQEVQPAAASVAARKQKVLPAVPFTVNQKSFTPPVNNDGILPGADTESSNVAKPNNSQAAMEEASRQAKEAVAAAMARLNPKTVAQPQPAPPSAAMDALSKKVSEMTTNGSLPAPPQAQTQHQPRGRGAYRGGRGQRSTSGGQRGKIEIPKSDFDFEQANAKFNKEDLIKEAIASGSPIGDGLDASNDVDQEIPTEITRKDSFPMPPTQAYNKSTSFFDNISSEAKEREEGADSKANARVMRGQEYKKNMETFGQGNSETGYRGRGRGYRGRGRGYGGGGRGYTRGYGGRGRGSGDATVA